MSLPNDENSPFPSRSGPARLLRPEHLRAGPPVPTLGEWFHGRFWREWVVARKNKPTEVRSKRIIFALHIEPALGALPLNVIGDGEVAAFRASLVETISRFGRPLSDKRINNILAVLSKPLQYAYKCRLIDRVPDIGLLKVERPEIDAWGFSQYASIVEAARHNASEPEWYVAVCLAGEAGLRAGEIKALRWSEDVDLLAKTITVRRQCCNGVTTTPKGRTRRTVPMTDTLLAALTESLGPRDRLVLHNRDGSAKTDGQVNHAIDRLLGRIGLPTVGWHSLRHTFGTHAALFGVNPWRLQAWMGHKRIDETMLYVHVNGGHAHAVPEPLRRRGRRIGDPDARVLAMLGARSRLTAKYEQKR